MFTCSLHVYKMLKRFTGRDTESVYRSVALCVPQVAWFSLSLTRHSGLTQIARRKLLSAVSPTDIHRNSTILVPLKS